MASVLLANSTRSDIRPCGRSLPSTAAYGKPSKIPVRSDSSSGSASDDSDDAAKSSLRAKRSGKSKIPRPLPVEKVACPTEATGSRTCTLQNKGPQLSGVQQPSSSAQSSRTNPKNGGAKVTDKKEAAKPKGGLERSKELLKDSASFNQARNNSLGKRQELAGILKKSSKTSKVTSKAGENAKKASGLPGEEQEKPLRTTAKRSTSKHPVNGKGNKEKLPLKKRQKTTSASRKTAVPFRVKKDDEQPFESDVEIRKEEQECDSSLSENSSELESRGIDYETESDELSTTDSDTSSVPEVSQSQKSEKQDPKQSEQDDGHGLQCVPEALHGQGTGLSRDQKVDGSERRVTFCEPPASERRNRSAKIREFNDDFKINIDFVYETESDEFTSSEDSESNKDQLEQKEEQNSSAQSSAKTESEKAEEDLALTDCEIDSIAEDDNEQSICFPKENKESRDNAATELAKITDKNVLAESGRTSLETAEEGGQVLEVNTSSEVTARFSVPRTNESTGPNTIIGDKQSDDSDDSFFGINVAKVFDRSATKQGATCIADYMKPKENAIHIERKDLQDVDDGDYLESNCESKEKELHVHNTIEDKVSAGIPLDSASEDKDEGLPQKCSSSGHIPPANGKDGKSPALNEDPFITDLEELLLAAEADIEEDARRRRGQDVSVAPRQTTPLTDEEYIPYKPPIAPKKHPKQKSPVRKDEVERFSESSSSCVNGCSTREEEDCLARDTNPDILLGKKINQIYDGILEASNESSKKGKTTSTDGTSRRQSTQAAGYSGSSASTSGASGSPSATTGGCGDDDPNDPTRRPQRQKEPEDKKDEETEQQRHKAAKKALVNKMIRVTDTLLQTGFQGLTNKIFKRRAGRQSAGNRENNEDDSVETLPPEEGTSLNATCCEADDIQGGTGEFGNNKLAKAYSSRNLDEAEDVNNERLGELHEEIAVLQEQLEDENNEDDSIEILSDPEEGTSLNATCCEADDIQGGTGEFGGYTALIKALVNENMHLKEEVSKLNREVDQKTIEVMQTLEKSKTYKNVISKMELDLELLEVEKNGIRQECNGLTNEEILKELRKLHAGLSEASKELVSGDVGSEIKEGSTSSPLSIELGEMDSFNLQQPPEVDKTSEVATLMHSITATTEELRDQITKSKVKLAKAYSSRNLDEAEDVNNERLGELREEIAVLQEQLEDERVKYATIDSLYDDKNKENMKLSDRVTDLEIELVRYEDRLKDAVTCKSRELEQIKREDETKGDKEDELVNELRLMSEGNDALKSTIESLKSRIRAKDLREIELESTVDELTTENERLLHQIIDEKGNLQKYQRENDQRIAAHVMEVADLDSAIQEKIEELVSVMADIDSFYADDELLPEHPCNGDIENGIKILYDVSGLLKTIGNNDLLTGQVGEVTEKRQQGLEVMIENLRQEVQDLETDKKTLEMKLKMMINAESKADSGKDESTMKDELVMLRQQLDERETQLTDLEQQMTAMQSDNASLSQLVVEVQELATKDTEVYRLQLEGLLNRIEVLQEEYDKHKVQINILNESLLECKEKNKALENEKEDLELGKEALQQKVKLKVKEVLEHMAKYETMRKSFQEATRERDVLKQRTQKQGKDLADQQKKIETLNNKLKTIDAEKEALEKKLKQNGENRENKDIDTCKGESQPVCKCTMAVSGQTNEIQAQNDDLKGKMEMYEAVFEQVKTENAEYVKALEESRENVMMVRKSSDEEIAKLKKDLEGKNLSEGDLQNTIKLLEDKIAVLKSDYTKALEESRENVVMVRKSSDEEIAKLKKDLEAKDLSDGHLQNTIKLLEERIVMLEAERAESLKLIKAIAERIQGDNELEECKKEWHEMERELRNKTSAPKSEEADTRKTLLAKLAERFEVRMREFDECLQYRHALQEEVICLKELRLEQKRELEWMIQEKRKMNKEIKERETEVQSIRRTSSEMISDLENQLKGREDSALELQEKATFLSQKVAQFEAEKVESDKKIKALLESLDAKKESESEESKSSNEEQSQSDTMVLMKTSQEKIMTLEKELKDRGESEITLQNNICSLERRIAELNAEKSDRESSIKTLLEALSVQKNLEEYVQKKDQLEEHLFQKLEEIKVECSQLRSAKEDLERQLASGHSQNLGGSDKLETELKNQIDKLSDEKIKTEKMLQEKESEVLLVKKTSEAKIEDLENQLRSKNLSEEELHEKMHLLQHKILLLEDEKVQHNKSISSMVRSIKAKEELSKAVKAKKATQKEYDAKLDEMELTVNKLRKEKKKLDCDMKLKKRYKDEYEELRHLVRNLREDIQGYDKHIEELQSIADECGEEEESFGEELVDEHDLSKNIQDLRNILSTSDAELLQTREALAAKISSLEVEKAEFESVLTALLNSMEAKENVGHCVEATREADKKMLKQMDEMLQVVQKLKDERERFERELHSSENIRVTMAMDVEMLQTASSEKISLLEQSLKDSFKVEKVLKAEKERIERELYASENVRTAMARDVEVLQTQSSEKISLLEQSLKGSFETEKDLKERVELMSKELARLEGEKLQADKTLQTMLASLQGREKLDQCLREQERIERAVKANRTSALKEVDSHESQSVATLIELLEFKEQQLEQSKTNMADKEKILKAKELELELQAKDAERQTRDFEECLKEKNETFKGLVGEVEKLKANITVAEEEKKGLLQKLDKHNKVSEEREEEVRKIMEREQNLHQRLTYAENTLRQLKHDKHDLKKQLRQERLERQNDSNSYLDKMMVVSDAIEQKHLETQNELCQMIEKLKNEIDTIQSEKETSIEEHRKAAEALNMELVFQNKREATLREQMNDTEDELAQTQAELKKQLQIQQEKALDIANLKSENKLWSDNVTKLESKLMNEMENMSKRENDIREEKQNEIKKLKSENDEIVENFETKLAKLEMDLKCQVKNVAKLREEKQQVIEELKSQEIETKELDQLKSTLKTLEDEGQRLREERSEQQSEATKSAQTLRDTITRLQEDLRQQSDINKDLHSQLNEMKTKKTVFDEENSRHEQHVAAYKERFQRQKEYLEKLQRKLKEQNEIQRRTKDNFISQVNELQQRLTRLANVESLQDEERTEHENNVRHLKIHIEELEAQINDLNNELMESRTKISVLEEMKVKSDAEYERQQQQVVSECQKVNANIDLLRQELHHDLRSTSVLENEIETLKGKTAEIHRTTEAQNSEIGRLYGISEGIIAHDEEQTARFKNDSEELRGQVLFLQQEKNTLVNTVDQFQLFVARHRVEMERLENMIKEQEKQMSYCEMQSFENAQDIKVIRSSIDNSERLRNPWHFYDDFKKRYHSTQSVQRPYSRLYSSPTRFH